MKIWLITILTLTLFTYSAREVHAEGILFQDNFDDPNLSSWKVVRNQQWNTPIQPCLYQNQTANWKVTNGKLGIAIDGPNCTTEILPRFLNLTKVTDYQIDYDISLNETTLGDRNLLLSWQDETNWYSFSLFGQAVVAQKVFQNAYETLENSVRYPFWPDQTIHVSLIFKGSREIFLLLDNYLAVNFLDSAHTYSGFKTTGLQAGVTTIPRSVTYFDNFVVRSLDPGINLDIPLIRQDDRRWGTTEYDSAKSWSNNPTITRWGCSLTSMVMILRYYDIYFLPDQTYITPDSLNTWLKSQADGYIGEGALNWLAISRLTKLIHDRYQTPKLEFFRYKVDQDLLEIAKTEIRQQRPVILHIDGHFFIGDGITTDEQDILTKDPYYPWTQVNQYPSPLIAVETFKPSFTDLSYFFLTHDSQINIQLINEKGEQLSNFDSFTERLHADDLNSDINGKNFTSSTVEHLLSKPLDGTYILEISAPTVVQDSFKFFIYDQGGNVTDFSQTGYFGPEPKYFILTYIKNQPPVINSDMNFGAFRQDLITGKKLNQIDTETGWLKLDSEAQIAELSGSERQKRYLWQISELLKIYTNQMTTNLSFILNNDLKIINQQLNVIISR